MSDNYWRDVEAISTWERGEPGIVGRSTGPRREPPATCRHCGGDVPPGPRFGNAATCDDCARAGKGLDPWLAKGTR